jgi:hypothetical protein
MAAAQRRKEAAHSQVAGSRNQEEVGGGALRSHNPPLRKDTPPMADCPPSRPLLLKVPHLLIVPCAGRQAFNSEAFGTVCKATALPLSYAPSPLATNIY